MAVAPLTVRAGGTLRVTDTVLDRGAAAAGASTSGIYLAAARIGSRHVAALHAHASSRGTIVVRVPRSLPPGAYRVRVCADDRTSVRESNERNNCRPGPLVHVVGAGDRTPPVFAGLESATTCIPGPAGGPPRESRYRLMWQAATDDVTPSSAIVYDVYQANAPGGEDFSTPTYTTQPGATSFVTPLLPDTGYVFVVRARDASGNRDANRIERAGRNLCYSAR